MESSHGNVIVSSGMNKSRSSILFGWFRRSHPSCLLKAHTSYTWSTHSRLLSGKAMSKVKNHREQQRFHSSLTGRHHEPDTERSAGSLRVWRVGWEATRSWDNQLPAHCEAPAVPSALLCDLKLLSKDIFAKIQIWCDVWGQTGVPKGSAKMTNIPNWSQTAKLHNDKGWHIH